jgi:murein DD-endopeptidase MepM/ murein hydrolase activator NlpD
LVVLVAVVVLAGSVAARGEPLTGGTTNSVRRAAISDDRGDVGVLQRDLALAQRTRLSAYYGQLEARRASRGQPRLALPGAGTSATFWRPTDGRLTQPFHPGHDGIDIGVPIGTPVLAAAAGRVSFAGVQSGYGNHIEVLHADGTVTTYSHLDGVDIAVGTPVVAGQPLARSGNTGHSTGPHLHFEVRLSGKKPTDPIAWLRTNTPGDAPLRAWS